MTRSRPDDETVEVQPLELIGLGFGDIITRPDVLGPEGAVERYYVLSRCEKVGVGYFCETHQQPIANVGNLAMHIELGGTHRVAVWCPSHRVYEAVDPRQFRQVSLALPDSPSTASTPSSGDRP